MDHIVDAPWLAPSVFSSDRKTELPPYFYLRYFNVFSLDPSDISLLREQGHICARRRAKKPRGGLADGIADDRRADDAPGLR